MNPGSDGNVPCTFRIYGCHETMKSTKLYQHQNYCQYRPYQCPFAFNQYPSWPRRTSLDVTGSCSSLNLASAFCTGATRNIRLEDAYFVGLVEGYCAQSSSSLHHVDTIIFRKSWCIDIEEIIFCASSNYSLAEIYWAGVIKGFKLQDVTLMTVVETILGEIEGICTEITANFNLGTAHSTRCPEQCKRHSINPIVTFRCECCNELTKEMFPEIKMNIGSKPKMYADPDFQTISIEVNRFVNCLKYSGSLLNYSGKLERMGKLDSFIRSLEISGQRGKSEVCRQLACKLRKHVQELRYSRTLQTVMSTVKEFIFSKTSICKWQGRFNYMMHHIILNHPVKVMKNTDSLKIPKIKEFETYFELIQFQGNMFQLVARIEKFYTYILLQYIGPQPLADKFRYGITLKTMDGLQSITEFDFTTSYMERADDLFENTKCLTFFKEFVKKCFNSQHELPFELVINGQNKKNLFT